MNIKNAHNTLLKTIFICLFMVLNSDRGFPFAGEQWSRETRIVYLGGRWKFSIGDNAGWAKASFNDNSWEEVSVPSAWEEQGFYGYDGYAWYRKHFHCPSAVRGRAIILEMGYLDDVDEVYINGHLAGSTGSFPPYYSTAYSAHRRYYIPEKYLNLNGDNVIAVRIYDAELSGGILSGTQQLSIIRYDLEPDYLLEGEWKFSANDDQDSKNISYDDSHWEKIIVPVQWELQGYPNLDGYAWYRKRVHLSQEIANKDLVLMMGMIDDMDEVYINGRRIGHTGNMDGWANEYDYKKLRGYYIPKGLLKPDQVNVIAVRVFDGGYVGGIYSGPVGFISQQRYIQYFRQRKSGRSLWDFLFNN
ncbi:MAG: beta galactosidase jelly roll domain-containing protein [Bacteroidota bacterium]